MITLPQGTSHLAAMIRLRALPRIPWELAISHLPARNSSKLRQQTSPVHPTRPSMPLWITQACSSIHRVLCRATWITTLISTNAGLTSMSKAPSDDTPKITVPYGRPQRGQQPTMMILPV